MSPIQSQPYLFMKRALTGQPDHETQHFPVVCIGASAGGLDAFKKFVAAIPEDTGMAFLIMQHFDAGYHSTLPEILKPLTSLEVSEIADDMVLQPGHIYIVPNDKAPILQKGILKLEKRKAKKHPHLPIDHFFAVMAEVFQTNTYGILLTGMGSDGTLGLKKIKEAGGVTFVQNPLSAKYSSMPQHAIDAQVVHFILDVEKIPLKLSNILKTLKEYPKPADSDTQRQLEDESLYKKILTMLRIRKGVDFSYYKQTTIRRRILRRMIITQVEELINYVHLLELETKEQEILYQDLLIPVTSFFRDELIFENLCEKVFPEILNNKGNGAPLRIWTAGCSTGEEAYSVAICLHEHLGARIAGMKVQLFATDLSEKAIQKARLGIYTKREVESISETRLEQFFSKLDGHYQVKKNIRDLCVFATHNFLKDPPFAKMDLISCRNVLIYMEAYLQKKALTTFHYALNEKGVLLLGKSETAGNTPELFKLTDKQQKFYTKKEAAVKIARGFTDSKESAVANPDASKPKYVSRKEDYEKNADDIFLSKYVPAAVVVNEHFEIVQFRGATGSFLEGSPGKASLNVLKMAKESLSFEIRNALHKARETKEIVIKNDILLQTSNLRVSIEVAPLLQTIEPHYLVVFKSEPVEPSVTAASLEEGAEVNLRVKQLEKDLAQLRDDMRTVTEDLEAANEELQSANEELLSGSEELQSLNEELETSKEEVQSTNEELMTINQELYDRNDQYNRARQYSEAIVNTITEPLLVLNRDLRIKSANPAFYETFRLRDDDITGKILFELQESNWDVPALRTPLLNVQTGQQTKAEWEVVFDLPGSVERTFFMTAQPVNTHTSEELILLAFKDITLQKTELIRLENSAKSLRKELKVIETFFMEAPALFCILKGPEHVFKFINPRYSTVSGGKSLIGKPFADAFPELENQGYKTILDNVFKTGEPFFGESMRATHFPGSSDNESFVDLSCQAYTNDDHQIEGVMFFAYEVTEQIHARHLLENNAAILEGTVQERTASLVQTNAALEKSNRNLQAFASIASHDLQEPLRKIKTFVGLLRNRYAKDFVPEANTLLQKTEVASIRMSNLIRDVLNYSRISMPERSFIPCDLNTIVQSVLEDFELLIAEKEVTVNLHNRLPELEAIPSQMNQLFYNLLGNALKFSDPAREQQIDIECEKRIADSEADSPFTKGQEFYRIIFRDNGIGFDPQYATQIFAVFERLNNASKYDGTGIGLALCLRIVQFHSGRINAAGSPGKGSTFTVDLPATQTGTNVAN